MNIIDAIYNIINVSATDIVNGTGNNRANIAGDGLEQYVKDAFAGTFGMADNEKLIRWNQVFSYLGNNSNPPDIMLKDGDAIEVKKIESDNSALALNSSYPKQKLRSNSSMISQACREAESWTEKDMIYVVGVVKNNCLKHLCMVYGLDYCADESCYARLKSKIKERVEQIENIEFTETKELGHINKVDPLGITYMRVRGMWGINNPWRVFNYIYNRPAQRRFSLMCIINETKWNSFNNVGILDDTGANVESVLIKNPDNPAQLRKAKLISYESD